MCGWVGLADMYLLLFRISLFLLLLAWNLPEQMRHPERGSELIAPL